MTVLWAATAQASVPNVLHFSGALKSEGAPFTGTMAMTFALYDGAEAVGVVDASLLQRYDAHRVSRCPLRVTPDGHVELA
jgi:hypothetical protein